MQYELFNFYTGRARVQDYELFSVTSMYLDLLET